ncbi:MAG: YciI family protein [Vicinamibacterales bacterium]
MPRYLFLQRSAPEPAAPPSPAQMQQITAAVRAWIDMYKGRIVDMGAPLSSVGAVVSAAGTADGPFGGPGVVGGYMIVETDTLAEALEVARESPPVLMGSQVEVREIKDEPGA